MIVDDIECPVCPKCHDKTIVESDRYSEKCLNCGWLDEQDEFEPETCNICAESVYAGNHDHISV